MKVWKRILIKTLLFAVVAAAAGAGGVAWKESSRDTARYALEQYAQHLIDQEPDRAYLYQDTEGEGALTKEEFTAAAQARKYSLYAGYQLEKENSRTDENGSEYEDYRISFVNSDGEEQLSEEIAVRKQEEKKFFFFDQWKVLPDHCMVKDFTIQVPAGSAVTVGGERLDASLIREDEDNASDTYVVPSILPETVEVSASHSQFDDLTVTVSTMDQTVDLRTDMQLSENAKAACLETGVKALREVLRQAAADEENAGEEAGDENLFALCEEETGRLIQEQRLALEAQSDEGYEFESVAVWEYNPRFEQPVYTEETGIQAVMELTFRYSWTFRYPEYLETGDYDENGEPILEESSREDVRPGEGRAKLTFSYREGSWQLTGLELPRIL